MSGWLLVPAEVLALLMRIIRALADLGGAELARRARMDKGRLRRYEKGLQRPESDSMARVLEGTGRPRSFPDRILPWVQEIHFEATREPDDPAEAAPDEALAQRLGEIVAGVIRAVLPRLRARLQPPPRAPLAGASRSARGAGDRLCARLLTLEPADRRVLVEARLELQTASVCHWLCEASEAAAARDAVDALDLAGLAVRVAHLVPGDGRRPRRIGRATAFLANARRVAGDLDGAGRDFVVARRLWNQAAPAGTGDEEAGGSGEAELADETRLLDLEASLRRDQRRWAEAFTLLDRALALHPEGEEAARILLKRAFTFEQKGDAEAAIATLRKAAGHLAEDSNPRLLCVLRFNLAATLIQLNRHAEAGPLVPAVRDLAARLENAIDEIRLRWLEGKIHAGLGRPEEAIAALMEVQAAFIDRRMAYDTALVTLELALLLAERGETGQVKALVEAASPVFAAQRIHREALACYRLLQDAAEREAVTAALARRLLDRLAGSA